MDTKLLPISNTHLFSQKKRPNMYVTKYLLVHKLLQITWLPCVESLLICITLARNYVQHKTAYKVAKL